MQPLQGIRVLDLSRVLAGPYCTMVLGDLGAEVIKVEPSEGDETRGWGPPFAGGESVYYLCVNRSLVYCSISGFGQTGSMRDKPGYDLMIQATGGVMSITGKSDGEPMKAGVIIADLFAGQNAVIAILVALQARHLTSAGQYLDISLFDSELGWLANAASNCLISGNLPRWHGNAHSNIVPYQSFRARNDWFVIAVGNDKQFEALCRAIGKSELGIHPRFVTNSARVENRDELCDS